MFEAFFEFVVQGTGFGLIRLFRPTHEPSEVACMIVGVLLWVVVGVVGYFLYQTSA